MTRHDLARHLQLSNAGPVSSGRCHPLLEVVTTFVDADENNVLFVFFSGQSNSMPVWNQLSSNARSSKCTMLRPRQATTLLPAAASSATLLSGKGVFTDVRFCRLEILLFTYGAMKRISLLVEV